MRSLYAPFDEKTVRSLKLGEIVNVTGAVVMLKGERIQTPTETELKLAQSAAAFLGKQMEE